jgi:uncharacterized membrane protein
VDVLLLNNNPVVDRLVGLCANQVGVEVVSKEILNVEDLIKFDMIIVDDKILTRDTKDILESTHMGYRVLLVSKNFDNNTVIFDEVVDKPFVPSRIIDIFNKVLNDKKSIEKVSLNSNDTDTQILDKDEVEKIKSILDENENVSNIAEIQDIEAKKIQAFKEHLLSDGVEITNEEEYIQSITKKPKKYKKALKELIDNAVDEIIDRVGKDSFKQAIKEDRVSIEFHIKEKE